MAVIYPKVRSYHGILSLLRDPFNLRGYYRQSYVSSRASLELTDRTATLTGNLLLNYRSSGLLLWYKDNPSILLFGYNYEDYAGAKNLVNHFLPIDFKVVVEQSTQYLVHTVGKKKLKYLFTDRLVINDYKTVLNAYTGDIEYPI
jgi:hypothetical protein